MKLTLRFNNQNLNQFKNNYDAVCEGHNKLGGLNSSRKPFYRILILRWYAIASRNWKLNGNGSCDALYDVA